jgi:hypothetical protein
MTLVIASGSSAMSRAAAVGPSVDIELAFDTTGSMAPSLVRARQDAEKILAGVRALVPDARFAVVAFRDPGNPGGEYQTLQPLTADSAAIERALGRLKAVHNTSPANLSVELYNLAFHRSFTDSALKWAQGSRKIVVVMGDAEGYGGGSSGLAGCLDTHAAPDGLELRAVLAGMRAAQRTLVMVREVSQYTTASLACYASMAAATYTGGAARDGTASDLVTPLVGLVRGAVAPITISTGTPVVFPGSSTSFAVTVANPNGFPLQVTDLTLATPKDFTAVNASPAATTATANTLTWTLGRSLPPHGALTIRVSATAGAKQRLAQLTAVGNFQLMSGQAFSSEAAAQLHVTRTIVVEAKTPLGRGRITGKAVLSLATARTVASAAGTQIAGSYKISGVGRRALLLKPTGYRLALVKGHAVARIAIRVIGQRGVPGCHVGMRGTLAATDRGFAVQRGNANIRLMLPAACRSLGNEWATSTGSIRPLP